jgi:PAS domain S-box-containing protein
VSPTPPNTPDALAGADAPAALRALGASLDAAGVGVAVADPHGLIHWANQALTLVAAAAGVDGLPGRRLDDLLSRLEDPESPAILALKPRRERFFRHIEAPVNGAARLHILIECTSEVAGERERKRHQVYLSRAADDSMDAIVSLDTDGRIRYWNKGAERMFGYSESEMLDRPYDLLVPPELKTEGELDRIAEILTHQGVLRNFETLRLARGGRPVEVDLTVTQLRDDSGTVLGRSVIYRDISLRHRLEAEVRENLARLETFKTELSRKVDELRAANLTLRRNQEKLIAMEKLSAVGEMAARVAHEIRTPLVTIGGFSNTLWKSMPADAPQRQYLEIIREEVRRLERIVSEILEYVKPVKLETKPCDVNAMVEESLQRHIEQIGKEGIELQRSLAEGLPAVDVDRYQIHQVLSNLLLNAMQALEYVPRETRRLTVTTEPGENHVLISIADTGPGIPERHRERVFRPFFTTKPAGSGLGLSISSQIVAQHRATLGFDSVEGSGTAFHLRLPTASPQ